MTKGPIGILGGMGPEATVLLMQKVLAAVHAKDDADHIHLLVDQNPHVPSRIRFLLEGGGDDPGPILAGMARRLQDAGAIALAMPCNTAHHFAATIRTATHLPFLDMVALSVTEAVRLAGQDGCVGILASPAVRRVGLFDAPMSAAGLRAIYASDEESTLATIRRIKSAGADSVARDGLRAASDGLLAQGARVQMIACTEFSLIADAISSDVIGFDTLDCLVAEIARFSGKSSVIQKTSAQKTITARQDQPFQQQENS